MPTNRQKAVSGRCKAMTKAIHATCLGCGAGAGGNAVRSRCQLPLRMRGCCRTACIDQCKTDGNVKPVRESHCVVDLHRRAHGAVRGCAADARGCRFRRQRERKVHVRTSELRRVLVATEGHGIVAMHAWTDIGVMGVSEAAQGPRAMRWDAFRFSRLLVIRPESTPSRS
jgi:hypothetical protein